MFLRFVLAFLHHRSLDPHLDQMQNLPVRDAADHQSHEFIVRDRIEVLGQIRVYDLSVLRVQRICNRFDRVVC